MAEKKIEHHIRVDPTPDGVVLIRFEKRVLNEAGEVLYHRTSVEPGTPLDEQMTPTVAHMVQLGFEAPDAATMAKMRAQCEAVHTPERVAKFKAEKEAREIKGGKP